jgi:1-acyl-sn-glycerol-3-phosphate acyltransferase
MNIILRSVATILLGIHLFLAWVVVWFLQECIKAVFPLFGKSKPQIADACAWLYRGANVLVMCIANPLWKLRILKGMPEIPEGTKYIVVTNHLSNADPWLSLNLYWPTGRDWKYICKGSLFDVPFGGWGLKNNGDLAVKFTKEKNGWGTEKGSVKVLMDDAKAAIERGNALAVYPEGVRNPNPLGPIGEFKLGFFDLAVSNGYSIVPVALSGADRMWPVRSWQFDAATAYMTAGDLVSSKGKTAEQLRDEIYGIVTQMRESHPDRVALAAKAKKE